MLLVAPAVLLGGCSGGGGGTLPAIAPAGTAGTYRTPVTLNGATGVLTIVVSPNGSAVATVTPNPPLAPNSQPVEISLNPANGAFTINGTVIINGVAYALNLSGTVNRVSGGNVQGTINGVPFSARLTPVTGSSGSS